MCWTGVPFRKGQYSSSLQVVWVSVLKQTSAFYTNVWLCLINRWTGQYLFHIQLENKRRKCQSQSGVAWSHRFVVVAVFVKAGFSNLASTQHKSPATSSICSRCFSCSITPQGCCYCDEIVLWLLYNFLLLLFSYLKTL